MPIIYSGVQYSGSWSLSSVANAQALGTWPSQPAPHLYAWGFNNVGQLGLGNITDYSSPKQIGSLTTWSYVSNSVGGSSSMVIKTDGTMWSWGGNSMGQLGLGNRTKYSSPKQVGALTNWSKVSAGTSFTIAIKTDGTLWAWGDNTYVQLGLGNAISYSSPVQVGSLTNWSTVVCDSYATMATKTDGTLWGWGPNYWGNIGIGSSGNYISSPVQVGALTTWSYVATGGSQTFAVKTDGTLWGWGYNGYGNLATGNTTNYSSPVQIGALTNWINITCAGLQTAHSIKANGTLWGWGYNGVEGVVGNNSASSVISSPVQIGALTNWSTVQHGYGSCYALKTDGTLWVWGNNANGRLGLGNTTSYSSPKQVGSLTTWLSVSGQYVSAIGIART